MLHVDGRALLSDDDTIVDDQFLLRRVRPIVEGTVGGIYDFRFTPDFAQGRTVIQDAYVTGRFAPGFQVTGGKFKAPIGLERLQSANDIRFVERAYPTQLVTNRDIGLQVAGDLLDDRLTYQVAYLNGANDGRSSEDFSDVEVNDDKEWAAKDLRAAVCEFRQLRAARPGSGRRGQLYEPGRQRDADAAAPVPHAGAVDVLQVPLGSGRDR